MLLRNDRGYTLVELMVTVSLVMIVLGMAIPSLDKLGNRFRLKGAANIFYGNLQRARMEAMKSSGSFTVVFQQSISGTSYDLVLFQDADADCRLDGGERIINRIALTDTGPSLGISGNTFSTNGDGLNCVRFNARGFPLNSAGRFSSGSITLRDSSSGHTIAINVSPLGEIDVDQIS